MKVPPSRICRPVGLTRYGASQAVGLSEGVLFEYRPGIQGYSFSRPSTASYRDIDRVLEEAASGVLRDGHYVENENGVLVRSTRLEAARTNELHNSDSPATQTRNLTAGTYTLWMEGSGSVDASGATDGSYGTATESTTNENDLTFTVSAQQDVTFTVNNTVTRFQCEEGSFRSSYVATAGSAVSRAADDLSFPISFGPQAMTVYTKIEDTGLTISGNNTGLFHIGGPNIGSDPRFTVNSLGDFRVVMDDGSSVSQTVLGSIDPSFGDIVEVAARLHPDGHTSIIASLNGGAVESASDSTTTSASDWSEQTLWVGSRAGGSILSASFISGPLIAPGVRTMDEMRSIAV